MRTFHHDDLWVSLDLAMIAMDSGETMPITNFQNAYGEPVNDFDEVAFVVAGPDADSKWWSIDLTKTQRVVLQ